MLSLFIGIGIVGRDPEITYPKNKKLASTEIAVRDRFFNKPQFNPPASWIPLRFWGRLAETVQEKIKKGTRVLVIGSLESFLPKAEEEGKKVYPRHQVKVKWIFTLHPLELSSRTVENPEGSDPDFADIDNDIPY